jgi:hypothetical protein
MDKAEDPAQLKLKKEDRVKEDKRKRETRGMQEQIERLLEQNKQIEARSQEIIEKLPFLLTKIHFLGYDFLQR